MGDANDMIIEYRTTWPVRFPVSDWKGNHPVGSQELRPCYQKQTRSNTKGRKHSKMQGDKVKTTMQLFCLSQNDCSKRTCMRCIRTHTVWGTALFICIRTQVFCEPLYGRGSHYMVVASSLAMVGGNVCVLQARCEPAAGSVGITGMIHIYIYTYTYYAST